MTFEFKIRYHHSKEEEVLYLTKRFPINLDVYVNHFFVDDLDFSFVLVYG